MAIDTQNQASNSHETVVKVKHDRRLPWYVKLTSAAVIGTVAVGAIGQKFDIPGVPKIGDYFTSTLTPESTEVHAKKLVIEPAHFSCRAIAAYDAANSQALVKAHGFDHAVVANKAKVVVMACVTEPEMRQVDAAEPNPETNVYPTDVYVKASSIVFNSQFSEPDTMLVDASGGGTELLEGGGQVGDSIIDGLCTIFTLNNCEKGLNNPLDAAVKTSHEDQAKAEQYLRITILRSVQEKCVLGDWTEFREMIVKSYQAQGLAQGASKSDVRVHFVDDRGNTLPDSFLPDASAQAIGSLIKSGAITDTMPDVEIDPNRQPTIDCGSANTSGDSSISSVGQGN